MRIALITMLILSFCMFADSVVQRIEEDQNLTVDQKALYLVYSVIDQTRLPMEYTVGAESVPCGFPALHEATILSSQVSESTLEQILALANRPVLSGSPVSFVSPSGHFRVHYTTTGYDATTLDYANDVAEYMDFAWAIECNSMGYFVPPPDGGVGGDMLYDVYVATLTGGTLGYTSSGGEYKPPDSTHACSASHIVMGAGLSDNYNKTTCAHEFMHAVQMSYDYNEPTWFMENCSVWMESNLYPEINWNGWYSEGAIRAPYKGIDTGNPYWYGASFWPRMMGLMFGADAVKEVWDNCAETVGANMWNAQADMFTNHGTNFEQGFMEYGVWRFFVGSYYNPAFDLYGADADSWGTCLILPWHSFTSFPVAGTHGSNPDYFLDPTGIAWIRLNLEDYQGGWAQFNFNGRDGYEWNLGAILFNGESFQFNWFNCDPSTGEASVYFPTAGWDFAIFFPAFMTETSVTASFAFTASYTTGIAEGEPVATALLSIESNPMVPGSVVSFTVPSTSNADLSVVDMAGRTVSTLFNGVAEQGLHTVEFNGDLASGTYFVVLRHGTSVQASRVSVLR